MLDDLVIRAVTPDDHDAMVELQRLASLANPGDRELLLANPDIIEIPLDQLTAETACAAVSDGVIVGFAIVLPRDDADADLDGLFVAPELWRHGIGRQLIDTALQLADAMGAGTLHVVGNLHAEAFYRRMGFSSGDRIKLEFGEGLAMWRSVR